MKDETSTWLRYAEENLAVARLSFEKGFLHACRDATNHQIVDDYRTWFANR